MFWLSLLHSGIAFAYLVFLVIRVRKLKRITLFHYTSGTYTLSALLFYPLAALNEWSIITKETTLRAFGICLIFVCCCVASDLLFYRNPNRQGTFRFDVRPTAFLTLGLVLLFLFGFVGFLRFFFIGGAVDHLGEVFNQVQAGAEYYAARDTLGDWMRRATGLGVSHATASIYTVFPVVTGLALLLFRHFGGYHFLFFALASATLSLLIASVFMERAPLLFSILMPLGAYFLFKPRVNLEAALLSKHYWRWPLVVMLAIVAVLGGAVYTWTEGSSGGPFRMLVERVLLGPCETCNFYLGSFPDVFPFRGWLRIINMAADFTGDDTATRDVALFVTGGRYAFNPNAGMLATAYSGAGLPGALVVTIFYLFLTVSLDKAYERYTGNIRVLNIVVSLFAWQSLANTPLLVALGNGFVVPSLFLLVLCRLGRTRVSEKLPGPARTPTIMRPGLIATGRP